MPCSFVFIHADGALSVSSSTLSLVLILFDIYLCMFHFFFFVFIPVHGALFVSSSTQSLVPISFAMYLCMFHFISNKLK